MTKEEDQPEEANRGGTMHQGLKQNTRKRDELVTLASMEDILQDII